MTKPRSALARLVTRPRRGLLGALLFAATMVVAGVLAYQAVGAAASHRAAAEATLAHHAEIAAWRFAGEARNWVSYGMNEAANRLRQESAGELRGPELVSTVLAEKACDCMSAGFARTVFRVRFEGQHAIDARGELLSERSKDGLVAAAEHLLSDTARRAGSRPTMWAILPPGTPRLARATDVTLLWLVPDREHRVRAAYGMVVEPEQIARPLAGARGDVRFFPPSLVPPSLADSLVRIEVAGPNRAPIFAAGPTAGAFAGSDTLGVSLGSMTVTASIAASAAPLLLAGGLPRSRVPTVVALLALALALGVAALLLLRRELRLARLREDFVSSVSHELRTPLTQIRLLSEVLQSDGFRTDAERVRATGVIHREALRLTNLVDNILEFTRLRRTSAAGPATRVSLASVASELAESLAPLLDAQRARIELAVRDDILVTAEHDAVRRVLRNLIENAVKYGPAGQTIRVALTRGEAPAVARITVDDQGQGIPRDEWSRIWQPYYRLDRDRNGTMGGSGLGLSVVADLMRELGGRAWVGDAPGGGARFTVEFRGAVSAGADG